MALELTLQSVEIPTTDIQNAILRTLAYADVFDYPLTAPEIQRYLAGTSAADREVIQTLDTMSRTGTVTRLDDYYVLPGRDRIVRIRRRRAEIAARLWNKALRYGELLAWLPFVRLVAVTGSLAMDNAEADMDIDFLLVTAPKRLWTCRALAILVTRLARLESVNLCPNYLITTNAIEFPERSLYAAHELVQMIPLSGLEVYKQIRSRNPWTDAFLPNAQGIRQPFTQPKNPSRTKGVVEAAIAHLPLEWLETWEMKRKIKKLSHQQSSSLEAYFSADVCKGHAGEHGQQTRKALEARLKGLEL